MYVETIDNKGIVFYFSNNNNTTVKIQYYKAISPHNYYEIKYIHDDEINDVFISRYMDTVLNLNSRFLIEACSNNYINIVDWDSLYINPDMIAEKQLFSMLEKKYCMYSNWNKSCQSFYKYVNKHILPPLTTFTEPDYTINWDSYDPVVIKNDVFNSGKLFDHCYKLVVNKQYIQYVMPLTNSFRIVFRPISGKTSAFSTEHITAGITSIILQIDNYINIHVLEKKLFGALNYTFNDAFIEKLLYYKCIEFFAVNYFYMIYIDIIEAGNTIIISLEHKCLDKWLADSLEKKLYELGFELPIWNRPHNVNISTFQLLISFGVQYNKDKIIKSIKNTRKINIQLLNIIPQETTFNFSITNKYNITSDIGILKGCTLRNYQLYACQWIIQHMSNNKGCILADDMGLGKTVVILAIMNYYINNYKWKFLLVVPANLIIQWENEIMTKIGLKCYMINSIKEFNNTASSIGIISYNKLRAISDDINNDTNLHEDLYNCIIIDEAHAIKNKKSKIFTTISQTRIKHRIAITATPIENKVDDILSLFEFIMPGFVGKENIFTKCYTKNVACQNIIKMYILRRTKQELLPELPAKIVQNCLIPLTKYQTDKYSQVISSMQNNSKQQNNLPQQNKINQIQYSMKTVIQLKQICNHATLYTNEEIQYDSKHQSAKWNRLQDLLETIFANNNSKVIIFTQYVQMGIILEKLIEYHLHTTPLFYHGQNNKKQNASIITTFQTETLQRILIVSLKAGGCGLNLTAANYIIHYDLWWNPSIEEQASDRAHRIGQKKIVNVYRFITPNTIEENIDTIICDKKETIEQTFQI